MKKSHYTPPKLHRDVTNTCSTCGLKSKAVSKSIKYNRYFCIDCLLDYIKQNL